MSNSLIELSVIVPCFNEQANIEELVLRVTNLFEKNALNGEIILVNDESTDGTGAEIAKFTKKFKNVVGIEHRVNSGIVEAWHSGLKKAQGKYVLTIDADLQYRAEDIVGLYSEIKKGDYDLVQGWRKEYKGKEFFRSFLSKSLSFLLNMLFFIRLPDIKSGFVIYERRVFADILDSRDKYRTFQHFFILAALKKGYRLKQIPITFYPRIRGESFIKHPVFFSFKVLFDFPRAIWEFGILIPQKIRKV